MASFTAHRYSAVTGRGPWDDDVTWRESELARWDAEDPLAPWMARFELPAGLVYLDGNSLGPLPRGLADRLDGAVRQEWGRDLIASWNRHDWIGLPRRVAGRIAPLIGAGAQDVAVGDSTTVNLFKLLGAALALRPGRREILSSVGNFPTDLYVAQGLAGLAGARARRVPDEALAAAIGPDTAVVMISHVDYRTGRVWDLAALADAARAAGALLLADLSHSAGVLPVDLCGDGVDLAVGCGYKFLNGGPGAPAYLYVAERHRTAAANPLSGWMGHRDPFAFETDYAPADGIDRFLSGTPPVLSLLALEHALIALDGVPVEALAAKARRLGAVLIEGVETRLAGHGFQLASPRDDAVRGAQVAFRHAEGYAIVQALIARGVVGDFRAPDIVRFGLSPLCLRHVDIARVVDELEGVMTGREWERPAFRARHAVT